MEFPLFQRFFFYLRLAFLFSLLLSPFLFNEKKRERRSKEGKRLNFPKTALRGG
ncbi:MAG: hypothetical protein KHW61_04060 [Clostridium sp.]|nr:hypothetical protein [Clostridium sp.]